MRPTRALLSSQTRLLRDFIADSLYNLERGYFSKQAPVGFLDPPIDFSSISNRNSYLSEVQNRYNQLQVAWLTPVEIFSPHFGASIAKYLISQHGNSNNPLRIYEIGGGTGTLARDVLSYLHRHRPDLHSTCSYTCVEISPALAQLQHQRVVEQNGGYNEGRFQVFRGDASETSSWESYFSSRSHGLNNNKEECFVVAMEVLDNLLHDRVWREHYKAPWSETWVETTSEGKLKEISKPVINDQLITTCLEHFEALRSSNELDINMKNTNNILLRMLRTALDSAIGESVFLPTGALKLFNTLHSALPNHKLIAADFDQLPDTVIDGWNAPLVSATMDGTTRDFSTYLLPPGSADIFFPSNFELLRRLYINAAVSRDLAPERVHHMKSSEFLSAVEAGAGEKDESQTKCRDGYNPMIEDYTNTSFLLSI